MPKINTTLENRQATHQTSMIKIEGMIKSHPISILIEPGASLIYVSPRIVELCKLSQEKFEKSRLIKLDTGTKQKVSSYVKNYEIMMNELNTHANLNTLPLGSHDLLIGIDCLEKNRVMLNCYDKNFTCMDDNGNTLKLKKFPERLPSEISLPCK